MKYLLLAIACIFKVILCLASSVLFYWFLAFAFSLRMIWDFKLKEALKIFDMYFWEKENSDSEGSSQAFKTPYDYFFGKPQHVNSKEAVSFF